MPEDARTKPIVSFIVPIAIGADVARLVASHSQMLGSAKSELILVFRDAFAAGSWETRLPKPHGDVHLVSAPHTSRCYRKDLGTRIAQADVVCYIDADCTFSREYLLNLEKYIAHNTLLRGRVRFSSGRTLVSRYNSIYRQLCDDDFFRGETFTPNLIMHKSLWSRVGGWNQTQNIDQQDDFILSQRIKRIVSEPLLRAMDVEVTHEPNGHVPMLVNRWFGYGLGYGYRYWSDPSPPRAAKYWAYAPPLIYRRGLEWGYLPFSLFQWCITAVGYHIGLLRFRKVYETQPISRPHS